MHALPLNLGRPPESVRTVTVEGGLLLLDTASNEITAYNDSAGYLWDIVRSGRPGDDVIARFASHFGIPDDIARRDVEGIVRDWHARGLLVDDMAGCSPRPRNAAAPAERRNTTEAAPASGMTCRIRTSVVAFAGDTTSDLEFLRTYFQHLQSDDERIDLHVALKEAEGGESMLVIDGVERLRSHDRPLILGAVHQTVLEHVHAGTEWLAMIHAGAVARDGGAIVMPAPSGNGKTTLIASLLRCGYDYLADDLVAVSVQGRVVPWPLPLSVKTGSWPILSTLYEDWSRFPARETPRGPVRLIVPGRDAWDRAPAPVQALVFPQYSAGAAAKITRLTAFEALQRLLGDRVWLGYPITEARVRGMLGWLGERPAYHLMHSDVADAARCLKDIR